MAPFGQKYFQHVRSLNINQTLSIETNGYRNYDRKVLSISETGAQAERVQHLRHPRFSWSRDEARIHRLYPRLVKPTMKNQIFEGVFPYFSTKKRLNVWDTKSWKSQDICGLKNITSKSTDEPQNIWINFGKRMF